MTDVFLNKEKNKGGRPTSYSQDLADKICEEIATGKSLRSICREDDYPCMASIFKWLRENKEFSEQYEKACQERTEAFSEEILDIADDGSNDFMEKEHNGNVSWIQNGEALQRSRLRVDTRKWIMSKMKPKKYGEKVDVTSDGKQIKGNTIIFSDFKDETNS